METLQKRGVWLSYGGNYVQRTAFALADLQGMPRAVILRCASELSEDLAAPINAMLVAISVGQSLTFAKSRMIMLPS